MSDHTRGWSFLTNHAHVLMCIAEDPTMRIRDLATTVGITERATQQIVRDLEEDNYVSVRRIGRRNVYNVRKSRPLRHQLQRGHTVGHLLEALPISLDSKRGRFGREPQR